MDGSARYSDCRVKTGESRWPTNLNDMIQEIKLIPAADGIGRSNRERTVCGRGMGEERRMSVDI